MLSAEVLGGVGGPSLKNKMVPTLSTVTIIAWIIRN
jgi:hypothetical protein